MKLNQARVNQLKNAFKFLDRVEFTNDDILKFSDEVSRNIILKIGRHVSSFGYPLPSNMKVKDILLLLEIVKKPIAEADEELRIFMINYFNDVRIQEMIQQIKNLKATNFNAKRKEILIEASEAYKQGMYHVSVPTFLAQIEGIIIDAYGLEKEETRKYHNIRSGISFDYQKKLLKNLLCEDSKKFNEKKGLNYSKQDRNHPINAFNEILSDYYENLMITEFKHGQNGSGSVSRHGILHGANVDYGTQETSLKIILFTNLLIKKIASTEPDDLKKALGDVLRR